MVEETFGEWLEKHADSIVDEVLREEKSKQNNDGEFEIYDKNGVLINTYTSREVTIHVAKKKGYTVRHKRQGVTQPQQEAVA